MTTGREEVGMILATGRIIGLLVRKEKNIAAIGVRCMKDWLRWFEKVPV